ncbi:CoA-transferase [Halorientalis halophila]|uniref:CoA-transferase n=1 Tax=Halorientalis halophila TaxID=3108499 RepID=UPI00300A0E68
MSDAAPTRREQLLFTAAQEFEDERTVFTGFHWPVVAARVARKLHAPDLTSVFEAGIVYRGTSETLPTSTTEINAFDGNTDMYGNSLDTLHTFLKSGQLDRAAIDVSNVDRFGNVNTTVVGEYDDPAVRLPGPGGANDIATHTEDLTLICGSADPERYQDRVSYVSSPGHIDGDGSREAAGFEPGTGPSKLVTPLGTFRFDETGRARLARLAPGASVDDVREMTGWEIEGGDYDTAPEPDADQLAVVREVLAEAADRNYAAIRP